MKRYYEEIEPKLAEYAGNNITIVCEKHVEALGLRYFDKEEAINNIYTVNELFEGKLDDMQFDYIVGNPPYQDGKKKHGRNKIYTQISDKCINLLNTDGIIKFITPSTLLRKSSRNFDIVNNEFLNKVDFSINNEFNIGVEIVEWTIDKSKKCKFVEVIHNDKTVTNIKIGDNIYEKSKNHDFLELFDSMKEFCSSIENRMFKNNNYGSGISKNQDSIWKYEIHKLKGPSIFVKKPPYFYKKQKWIYCNTLANKRSNILKTIDDFYVNWFAVDATDEEFENINSFVFSEYFVNLVKLYRSEFNTGFDYIIKYCPKFDKSKSWTNEEVQSFFENREWLE